MADMKRIIKVFFFVWIVLPLPIFASDKTLVPSEIVANFLLPYSPVEQEAIAKDYKNIHEFCFSQAKDKQQRLVYVAIAGGPGSSKSTILESYLHDHPGFVYVDPDQRVLKFMINTYLQEMNVYAISRNSDYNDLLKRAYGKWRNASNYIANSILNDAYAERLAIAHGTTSTNKNMPLFYEKLKKQGYKIILLLCGSTDENRLQEINNRETKQCFVQAASEDVKKKERLFFENFPVYFKFADEIQLYWTDRFSEGAVMVGDCSPTFGCKKLHKNFEKLKNAYEDFRKKHADKHLPSFENLLLMNAKSSR